MKKFLVMACIAAASMMKICESVILQVQYRPLYLLYMGKHSVSVLETIWWVGWQGVNHTLGRIDRLKHESSLGELFFPLAIPKYFLV